MDVVGLLGAQPPLSACLRAATYDFEVGEAEGTVRPGRVVGPHLTATDPSISSGQDLQEGAAKEQRGRTVAEPATIRSIDVRPTGPVVPR